MARRRRSVGCDHPIPTRAALKGSPSDQPFPFHPQGLIETSDQVSPIGLGRRKGGGLQPSIAFISTLEAEKQGHETLPFRSRHATKRMWKTNQRSVNSKWTDSSWLGWNAPENGERDVGNGTASTNRTSSVWTCTLRCLPPRKIPSAD